MAIDKAELATEIEKNPEIVVAATEALQKKGFSIYDKAKHDEFITNLRKDTIEKELPKAVSKEVGEIHSKYDNDIESVFGVKKSDPNEKTYDYLKRVGRSALEEKDKKIAEYEKTIREKGDPQGILQKKIEDAENRAKAAIEERDKKIAELSGENATALKSINLNNAYAEISKSFVKTLPPMFNRTKDIIIADLLKTSVLKDGKLYAGDGSGGVKRDAAFKEIPIEDILKAEFKDVIDVKREQRGAGSGKGQGNNEDHPDPSQFTVENFPMPDVKTQQEVVDALLKAGVQKGSEEFKAIYSKYALGVEVTKEKDGKITRKTVGKALPLGQ